jgi:hypothetical protein
MTLTELETKTKAYADSRDRLAETLQKLDDQIESLKRQYLPGIKVQVRIAKEHEGDLRSAIEDSKSLFVKPRTVIMWGVKIGFGKAKGKIEFTDADQVVRLIENTSPNKPKSSSRRQKSRSKKPWKPSRPWS